MFTGIIREQGTILSSTPLPDKSVTLTIQTPLSQSFREGDSVAVQGVCLTVLSSTNTTWTARLMAETIQKTTLALLPPGKKVNIELPTKASDLLHGHVVQGHVDGTCTVTAITPVGDDRVFTFQAPPHILSHIIPKGSVALDGVSLTVVDVTSTSFTVSLMPYTVSHTTFASTQVGDAVHVETDKRKQLWYEGVVVRGNRKGTALGFPTANITLAAHSPTPPEGIFACRAMIDTDPTLFAAALHSGPRPTFQGIPPAVELHLLSFPPRDLYGSTMRFYCIEKIRDIEKFLSEQELTAAIARDISCTLTVCLESSISS